MIKYTTALRLGTAETEAILRRFTKKNVQHPTYKALAELGKAIKTIFLCRYLHSKELRREINEGLNVVEQWNGATDFVFFARRGEMVSNRPEDHEISMLALHLIQNCMVYQHADDSEGPGAAALAWTADTTRLRRADPADMGAREPVWSVRP
jgi:TnpA family transposase